MISDQGIDDLHSFARELPLRYLSFGIDHYDVPEELYQRALDLGAVPADGRELVATLRRLGLRRRRGKVARSWVRSRWAANDFDESVVARVHTLQEAVDAPAHPMVFARPGTTVVMVEGPDDPRATTSNEVVTRWGTVWSVELVLGEF